MKQASRKAKAAYPLSDKVAKNIREGLVFGSLCLAIYLFIALFSYSQNDSSWSYSVDSSVFENNAGAIGAYIADILLYIFGYFGYLIPFIFVASGWRLYQTRLNQKTFDYFVFSIHSLGVVSALLGGCGLLWMYFDTGTLLPYEVRGAGGILGFTIGPVLLKLTGAEGSTLIMLAMFMIGLTLYTGLSWLWVTDSTGKFILDLSNRSRNYLSSLKDNIEVRRVRKDRESALKI